MGEATLPVGGLWNLICTIYSVSHDLKTQNTQFDKAIDSFEKNNADASVDSAGEQCRDDESKSKILYSPRDFEEQIEKVKFINDALPKAWPSFPVGVQQDIQDKTIEAIEKIKVLDDSIRFDFKTELSLFFAKLLGKQDMVKSYRCLMSELFSLSFDLFGKTSQLQGTVSLKSGEDLTMPLDESLVYCDKNEDLIDFSQKSRRKSKMRSPTSVAR